MLKYDLLPEQSKPDPETIKEFAKQIVVRKNKNHESSLPLLSRFAPSPTGYMHEGTALSCAYVVELCEEVGAKYFLRIEDHDQTRYREIYKQALLEDLRKIGFFGRNCLQEVKIQTDRANRYQQIFDRLVSTGAVYRCRCSRKDLEKRTGQSELYDNHCRDKFENTRNDEQYSFRLRSDLSEVHRQLCPEDSKKALERGDIVVRERSGQWSYVFCVVIDDMDQQVNLVIRGNDILPTHCSQIYLHTLLQEKYPHNIIFIHHPLVLLPSGEKQSKSQKSTSLRDFWQVNE